MSIDGQGHFFTIYFQVLYVLCFTRPRYQVSVYRTIGPLVFYFPKQTSLLRLVSARFGRWFVRVINRLVVQGMKGLSAKKVCSVPFHSFFSPFFLSFFLLFDDDDGIWMMMLVVVARLS